MASFRFLRSSFANQFCRGLSTEPAIATFQPSKVAVKAFENDPTNHTKEDIGKFYTIPEEVKNKLFSTYLPTYYKFLIDIFNETNVIIRQPSVELLDYLKTADYNRPIIRYVIYGKFGCGKTLTLSHALNYAYNNNFIIVHIPCVWKWFHRSKEVVSLEGTDIIDLPLDAGEWLKYFELTNSSLISKLDLRVSKTYEWSQREKTLEGAPLNELVTHGINRIKFACKVIDALLDELKFHSSNKRCKTFVGIDGYNGFFQTTSRLKTQDKVRLIPSNVSLTKSFLSFVKNDWSNGAAVLVADDRANVKGHFTSHLPFHLLKKHGVESIDPFIPINVPEFTPIEFHNYLDYFEEKRWLRSSEGRDEIEFLTQRNPNLINEFCGNR